jgi:hypothetical protein
MFFRFFFKHFFFKDKELNSEKQKLISNSNVSKKSLEDLKNLKAQNSMNISSSGLVGISNEPQNEFELQKDFEIVIIFL